MTRHRGNRGIVLISTLMAVSMFLVYTNALTMRTLGQHAAVARATEQYQALDVAQAAVNQFVDEFHRFFRDEIYLGTAANEPAPALVWLDALNLRTELPRLDVDGTEAGRTSGAPRFFDERFGALPPVERIDKTQGNGYLRPRAWIVSVLRDSTADPNNPLAPRILTVQGEATVGAVTKQIEAKYRVGLEPSSVFKYAYFVNNYGWMIPASNGTIWVYGEVRSNGNLRIGDGSVASANRVRALGDLYASVNPDVVDPVTGLSSTGQIFGNPWQYSSWQQFWESRREGWTRPAIQLVNPTPITRPDGSTWLQPLINGASPLLEYGRGWDTTYTNSNGQLDQRFIDEQDVEPMAYLGDLELYKNLAQEWNGNGGELTYNLPGADGQYGTPDDILGGGVVEAVYAGPSNDENLVGLRASTHAGDDKYPLVLVGTLTKPIVLDGPVVVPGDVIIKGVVSGKGTIYAGRNIHIVGPVSYLARPTWPSLYRSKDTGEIRERIGWNTPGASRGFVCHDGAYYTSVSDPDWPYGAQATLCGNPAPPSGGGP